MMKTALLEEETGSYLEDMKRVYPRKFASEETIFKQIHPGARLVVGTGCGEPQYLVKALLEYVKVHPKAFFDAEMFQVWMLGLAPYAEPRFADNFRLNSFFVGNDNRDVINQGIADYSPVFLSEVPKLFTDGIVPVDVALIQVSPPNANGYLNLGVSVDIIKAVLEKAKLIIAQMNVNVPRVHGDGFINCEEVDYIIPHDEPLLEYLPDPDTEIVQRIGRYVARLVRDGDTLQAGYGSLPGAVLSQLHDKKHLGIHSELLSDGIVELMKLGVVDNSRKTINRGKTIASFCMGSNQSYRYLDDNPAIELRTIDYTNNPLVISQHRNMTAINSALEIDLTGQATVESIGDTFYSGIGGLADFMRGAALAPQGKSILALPATARGGTVSRIVPYLKQGAGVSLNHGDIHYVVTEYGIAYLHGKNIRERTMALISIAHPQFRAWLMDAAKERKLVFPDQTIFSGKKGEYPEEMEMNRVTEKGLAVTIRPVRIDDEPLLKEFFYSLSLESMYRRFMSSRLDMPHRRLQEYVVVDYTRDIVLLATVNQDEREEIIGVGTCFPSNESHTAEVALLVKDIYHNKGVGSELLDYLMNLGRKQGLLGLFAEVLIDNKPVLHLLKKAKFTTRSVDGGMQELVLNL